MNNPWEFKTDDIRTFDNLYTFNIFCEGNNSEPIYFKWFETQLIKIITHGNQKSMCKNLNKTITKCLEDGILKISQDGKYEMYEDGMEIWCVFDRDKGANGISIEEGDVDFNSALIIAENTPINVAWSNDSFDLWFLLHFENIQPDIDETKNRKYYFERLTDYFKNHPSPNALLERTLQHGTFSYENDLKQEKKIKQIILPEITPNTIIAIKRAKQLLLHTESIGDFSQKSPSTTVFKLIERLLEKGKKILPTNP